jgi:hypothetical protein
LQISVVDEVHLPLTRTYIQACRLLLTCSITAATECTRNGFVKTCKMTLTPLPLACKGELNQFVRLFVRPNPNVQSPLRPLLLEGLDAAFQLRIPCNVLGVSGRNSARRSILGCDRFPRPLLPGTETGQRISLAMVQKPRPGLLSLHPAASWLMWPQQKLVPCERCRSSDNVRDSLIGLVATSATSLEPGFPIVRSFRLTPTTTTDYTI